ncbi:MAG: glycoside hydrolase family 43 protein [bacterium]
MFFRKLLFCAIALIAFSGSAFAAVNQNGDSSNALDAAKQVFLFSYFHDNGGPGDGLHLAWSEDAYKWSALNGDNVLFTPTVSKVFRDPFILRGPDGVFRMVWTTGWEAKRISFGYAESRDLIHWTNEKDVPVMTDEPTARNCWAPEIFYVASKKQYMIFWSTTIPGRFPATDSAGDDGYNHRIYYTTTTDFETFAPAKLLYDPKFNCIDATIVFSDNRFIMFLKNETRWPPKKNIVIATSENAEGPYSLPSKPITTNWVEGPTVLRIGDTWNLYYDSYTLNSYGLSQSQDLKHWKMISGKLKMPAGARHGTAFAAPFDIFSKLPK